VSLHFPLEFPFYISGFIRAAAKPPFLFEKETEMVQPEGSAKGDTSAKSESIAYDFQSNAEAVNQVTQSEEPMEEPLSGQSTEPGTSSPKCSTNAGSTGPRTPQGKRRSSKNAIKHGFFSGETVRRYLRKEERRIYLKIFNGLFEYWKPVGQAEVVLLELMVNQLYQYKRLLRLMSVSRAPLKGDLGGVVFGHRSEPKPFDDWRRDLPPLEDLEKFQQLEQHIWRTYFRAQSELERFQAARLGERVLPRLAVDINAQ
jgi:hypothetical protein